MSQVREAMVPEPRTLDVWAPATEAGRAARPARGAGDSRHRRGPAGGRHHSEDARARGGGSGARPEDDPRGRDRGGAALHDRLGDGPRGGLPFPRGAATPSACRSSRTAASSAFSRASSCSGAWPRTNRRPTTTSTVCLSSARLWCESEHIVVRASSRALFLSSSFGLCLPLSGLCFPRGRGEEGVSGCPGIRRSRDLLDRERASSLPLLTSLLAFAIWGAAMLVLAATLAFVLESAVAPRSPSWTVCRHRRR